jgi:filamentous hemagglutinin family protein
MNQCWNFRILFQAILALLLMMTAWQSGWAEGGIVTDGTLGHPPQLIKANELGNIDISEKYGARHGGNLFHSFSEFNINKGQSATFREKVSGSTENVIARVTGHSGSDINGLLSVTPNEGGKANFYLINPNGIVFGEGSSISVPGSIHLSTADYIKLKDGKIFSAVNPQPIANLLSSAPPAAFGFLESSTKNNGFFKMENSSIFSTPEGKIMDFVTRQFESHSSSLSVFNLTSSGGVRIVALKSPGEISVETNKYGSLDMPALSSNLLGGYIHFEGGSISVSGIGSGKIGIWGGTVDLANMNGSDGIVLVNIGDKDPDIYKGIFITADSLNLNNVYLSSQNSDVNGKSANISLETAGDIGFNNLSKIEIQSTGKNDAGNISVHAGKNVILQNTSEVLSQIDLLPENNGAISALAGNIKIVADNDIKLLSGSSINKTIQANEGTIGKIELSANDLLIDNANNHFDTLTGIFTDTTSKAIAGDINIMLTGNLAMLNGSEISSSTTGSGSSGNINISANNINIKNALIKAESKTENSGRPGFINLTSTKGIIINTGVVSILSKSLTNNGAGSINLSFKNNNLLLKSSEIITESNGGNGGDITLTGDNIVMETALIQANSNGKNTSGGAINLNVKNLLASGNQLTLGGRTPITDWNPASFGFNVIQSAAPNGINGLISISAPVLNLSGTLSSLGIPKTDSQALKWDDCFSDSTTSSVSLVNNKTLPGTFGFWLY